ncbi:MULTISPECIES: hypothetical protein [unclassified Microbulbifer]|nr:MULTISPECIES: hypothetical protein [unclassified Microbulbifer]
MPLHSKRGLRSPAHGNGVDADIFASAASARSLPRYSMPVDGASARSVV